MILNEISFPSPEADVEFLEVLGRDGEIAIDNKRLKSVDFAIPLHLKLPNHLDVGYMSGVISDWLKSDIGWHPFRFSGTPNYEYEALCHQQFNIEETLSTFGRTVITFKLKPVRRLIRSSRIEVKNDMNIINPSHRPSKPLIYLEGSGPIIIKNNGVEWLVLSDIDEYITIDSELMSVYKDDSSQFDKMDGTLRPLFPILNSRDNKISWEGDVTKMELHPRWSVML